MDPDRLVRMLGVAVVKLVNQLWWGGPPCEEHIAAPSHVYAIAVLARNRLHELDAVVRVRRHDRVRPPVPVIFARLRRREAHWVASIDNHEIAHAMIFDEIISDRDADDASADHNRVGRAIQFGHQKFPSIRIARRTRGKYVERPPSVL